MRTQSPVRQQHPRGTGRMPAWQALLVVVVASLLLGGATSWAQGALPDALQSFANSVSGWTIVTAALVAALRPSLRTGALLGPVGFVCLVLGYTVVSELRGFPYQPLFWIVVGVLAGPFVGAAAAACVGQDRRTAAVGSGLLAGVLVADGIYGLTVVGDSTSPVYWVLVLALAVGLLALAGSRGARVAWLLGTTAVVVVAATAGFAVLNAVLAGG